MVMWENLSRLSKYTLTDLGVKDHDVCNLASNVQKKKNVCLHVYVCMCVYEQTYTHERTWVPTKIKQMGENVNNRGRAYTDISLCHFYCCSFFARLKLFSNKIFSKLWGQSTDCKKILTSV